MGAGKLYSIVQRISRLLTMYCLGIIECDVSFTSDRELVCRHSNCDLHYTTGKTKVITEKRAVQQC